MITYNVAISACEKAKQSERPWSSFVFKGWYLNMIIYDVTIRACDIAKQSDSAAIGACHKGQAVGKRHLSSL